MTMEVSAVRDAVASRLATAVPTLLRESPEPYLFIRGRSHSPVHMEYAVGVTSSEPLGGLDKDRQRPSLGVLTRTDVRVSVPYQLSPKDRVNGYTAALGLQSSIVKALVATGWSTEVQILWVRSTQEAGPDAWTWLDTSFLAYHLMPLS